MAFSDDGKSGCKNRDLAIKGVIGCIVSILGAKKVAIKTVMAIKTVVIKTVMDCIEISPSINGNGGTYGNKCEFISDLFRCIFGGLRIN